jgi:hypothetical protein
MRRQAFLWVWALIASRGEGGVLQREKPDRAEFSAPALAAQVTGPTLSVPEFLVIAVRHYLAQLAAGRMATTPPRLGAAAEGCPPGPVVDAALPGDTAEPFVRHAKRLGISVSSLLDHAALLYVADVDAGRARDPLEPSEPEPGGDQRLPAGGRFSRPM